MTPTTIASTDNTLVPHVATKLKVVYDEKPFIPLLGFQTTLEFMPGRSAEYRVRHGGSLNAFTCTLNYRLRMPDGRDLFIGVHGADFEKRATLLLAYEAETPVLSIIGVARLENYVLVHRNDLKTLPECMDEAYRVVAEVLSLPR